MGATSASTILRTKIALAQQSVGPVYEQFWEGADALGLFSLLQLGTYDVARASVSLMEAALTRCEVLSPSDPVCAGLLPYLREHIEEERDHDAWLLDDLVELGFTNYQVLTRPPTLTAARLVGAQYYWIYHAHPIALAGYMAVLEGSLIDEDFLEDFIIRNGIPREGARTLLLHVRDDRQHNADLDELIDSLPLSPWHATAMGISALHTVSLLATLTQEVMDEQRPEAKLAVSPA